MARKSAEGEESALTLLDPGVIRELSEAIPSFDRGGFLADILEVWGGQRALARSLYVVFNKAAPGSQTQQRVIDLIARLISLETDRRPAVGASELTDEQLRQEMAAAAEFLKDGAQAGPAAG